MTTSTASFEKVLALCSVSTKMMAKTFFPERFVAEFSPKVHDPIFDLVDSSDQYVAIAAPRGIGKTSIVGLAKAAQAILFRKARFICYVSHSNTNAEMQTENLKRELTSNKAIRQLFGTIKPERVDGMEESFSKSAWVALDTFILPRGSGQQVRGLLYKNARPDLIIVDDLEDPETIESEDIRTRRKNWFNADLLKSTSRTDPRFKIIYIDTLKHQDSLLESLLSDTSGRWKSTRLEICDDNFVSNAPSFMTDEMVRKEYDYHREQGILDVFAREFRNRPISLEDAVFKQEYFRNYEESDIQDSSIENVLLIDPAKTVKLKSAHSALVVVGIDLTKRAFYVRDIVADMLYPDQLFGHLFDLASRWRCRAVGVEVTSLNEFITQPIRNEMSLRGANFELIELKARGKKEERIAALAPYYRQGFVYHNPQVCKTLELQLLAYPRPWRWDIMDALAYLVELLDIGHRYFEPPEDSYDELYEDELSSMKRSDDKPLVGWRTV